MTSAKSDVKQRKKISLSLLDADNIPSDVRTELAVLMLLLCSPSSWLPGYSCRSERRSQPFAV